MLRITITDVATHPGDSSSSRLMNLEGALVSRTVPTLCAACRESLESLPRLSLDLAGVTYIDARGAACLTRLRDMGVELRQPSSFVTAVLEQTGRPSR